MRGDLGTRAVAEALGTGLLVATVVGSGIMAERLAGSAPALALLCNTLATGAGLTAILLALGPISGAQLNPAVSLVAAARGQLPARDAWTYVVAQLAGGMLGAVLANAMFEEPLVSLATHPRSGSGQLLSEVVATFGLLLVTRTREEAAPFAVGAYITAAYWFTASTSFANPAVTIARCLTHTYAGIRIADAPGFVAAQLVGAVLGMGALSFLARPASGPSADVELMPVKRVIFACVHNAGRSQMAAAIFNARAEGRARADSAGTEPSSQVHPVVVAVMAEVGVDLSGVQPRLLTDELARGADLLITMGCGEACPVVPGLAREDWPLPDPAGRPASEVRVLRADIVRRVDDLLHRWPAAGPSGP